jgi:hypothetical protein
LSYINAATHIKTEGDILVAYLVSKGVTYQVVTGYIKVLNIVGYIPLSITNKMLRHTIFFIALNALHVSGGFSAHHQELRLYTQHLVYVKLACCYR